MRFLHRGEVLDVKIPKTLGGIADAYYRKREERLALDRKVKELKAEEELLKEAARAALRKAKTERASGKLGTISLNPKIVATVDDWEALYKYIKKHDAFELLQRRIGLGAYVERLEAGEQVPGVKPEEILDVSLHKATRR